VATELLIYTHASRLKAFLIVSRCGCLYVSMYVCVSTSLWLNISETKGDSSLFSIGSLYESA